MGQSPTAVRRLRRPAWRDPRLGVGVVLVALAIVLGTWAVDRAGRTVQVYAADSTLTPGDTLTAAELRTTSVPPGAFDETYVLAGEELPEGAVAVRVVEAGELVPRSAVGSAAELAARPVSIPLPGGAPPGLTKGRSVDLWLTEPAGPGSVAGDPAAEPAAAPALLAESLVVLDVTESDSLFTGGGGNAAQVLVPRPELPRVLGALAGALEVVVIPVPGGP